MQQDPIKNIVIAGGGTAGWMTAAALAKLLGVRKHKITLVESEAIGTVGVGEATIPMITLFNNALQIDENEFIRETNATFKLGIEFPNWRRKGHSYFHPFGSFGIDMDGISFTHYWLRWHQNGGKLDYTKFNAETEAARELKFQRVQQQGVALLPNINYAYHFDASLYAKFLRGFAEKRGVVRQEGLIERVLQSPEDGRITGLQLKDGQTIQGDLFIDCTGFRGLLIEQTLKSGFDDWSQWLPVNRAVAVPFEIDQSPPPYTRAIASEAGWQWRIPLQHRMGSGYVFCDAYISEEEATRALMESIEGTPKADPRVLKFTTGVRKKAWIKNCVSIGLSNGFLEPLESTSIHLIQVAIAKILTMFPRGGISQFMIDQYNEEMSYEYENVKDFLIAHYHVTERDDTEFWKYVRNMAVPDSLSNKLELFRTRGEVMTKKADLFKENSWFAVLAGQGLMPDGYHPVADSISDDDLRVRLSQIRSGVVERINGMPSHVDYLAAIREGRSGSSSPSGSGPFNVILSPNSGSRGAVYG